MARSGVVSVWSGRIPTNVLPAKRRAAVSGPGTAGAGSHAETHIRPSPSMRSRSRNGGLWSRCGLFCSGRRGFAFSPAPPLADDEVDPAALGPDGAEPGLLRDHPAPLDPLRVAAPDLPDTAVEAREQLLGGRECHRRQALYVAAPRRVDQHVDVAGGSCRAPARPSLAVRSLDARRPTPASITAPAPWRR